jgi:hypothetical protein
MLDSIGINRKRVTTFLLNNIILFLLVVISIVVGILRPTFFSGQVVINLINNTIMKI